MVSSVSTVSSEHHHSTKGMVLQDQEDFDRLKTILIERFGISPQSEKVPYGTIDPPNPLPHSTGGGDVKQFAQQLCFLAKFSHKQQDMLWHLFYEVIRLFKEKAENRSLTQGNVDELMELIDTNHPYRTVLIIEALYKALLLMKGCHSSYNFVAQALIQAVKYAPKLKSPDQFSLQEIKERPIHQEDSLNKERLNPSNAIRRFASIISQLGVLLASVIDESSLPTFSVIPKTELRKFELELIYYTCLARLAAEGYYLRTYIEERGDGNDAMIPHIFRSIDSGGYSVVTDIGLWPIEYSNDRLNCGRVNSLFKQALLHLFPLQFESAELLREDAKLHSILYNEDVHQLELREIAKRSSSADPMEVVDAFLGDKKVRSLVIVGDGGHALSILAKRIHRRVQGTQYLPIRLDSCGEKRDLFRTYLELETAYSEDGNPYQKWSLVGRRNRDEYSRPRKNIKYHTLVPQIMRVFHMQGEANHTEKSKEPLFIIDGAQWVGSRYISRRCWGLDYSNPKMIALGTSLTFPHEDSLIGLATVDSGDSPIWSSVARWRLKEKGVVNNQRLHEIYVDPQKNKWTLKNYQTAMEKMDVPKGITDNSFLLYALFHILPDLSSPLRTEFFQAFTTRVRLQMSCRSSSEHVPLQWDYISSVMLTMGNSSYNNLLSVLGKDWRYDLGLSGIFLRVDHDETVTFIVPELQHYFVARQLYGELFYPGVKLTSHSKDHFFYKIDLKKYSAVSPFLCELITHSTHREELMKTLQRLSKKEKKHEELPYNARAVLSLITTKDTK